MPLLAVGNRAEADILAEADIRLVVDGIHRAAVGYKQEVAD